MKLNKKGVIGETITLTVVIILILILDLVFISGTYSHSKLNKEETQINHKVNLNWQLISSKKIILEGKETSLLEGLIVSNECSIIESRLNLETRFYRDEKGEPRLLERDDPIFKKVEECSNHKTNLKKAVKAELLKEKNSCFIMFKGFVEEEFNEGNGDNIFYDLEDGEIISSHFTGKIESYKKTGLLYTDSFYYEIINEEQGRTIEYSLYWGKCYSIEELENLAGEKNE